MKKKQTKTDLRTLIGQKFGPDNRLEVLALNPTVPFTYRTIQVYCSVCAEDPEMFGDGIYNFNATSVKNKSALCGCDSRYAFSEAQNILRFKRLCAKSNIEFLGFKDGHRGANSVLLLRCKEDGFRWQPNVTAFLKSPRCSRCEKQGSDTHRESTTRLIARFMATGGYPEDTKFIREKEPGKWGVVCPTCSHNGEVFNTTISQLSKGCRPCKCTPSNFDPKADYKLYVMRICSDAYDFTGYGISRVFGTRLAVHRNNLARVGFQISEMETFDMKGAEALRLENAIGKAFPLFRQPVVGFVREASYYWLYDDILSFIEDKQAKLAQDFDHSESF